MSTLIRSLLIYLAVVFLTACGGGGGGGGSSSSSSSGGSNSPPSITSFVASASTITAGSNVNLTAVFTNGTGSINGVGAVDSNVAKSVTPSSTTTYTLTVANTAGVEVTSSVTVNVTVHNVQISWNTNPATAVNRSGGGYKVYYSSTTGFNPSDSGVTVIDVPFVSGAAAPTSVQFTLPSGTYYVRIAAYSSLNAPGSSAGSLSTATPQITHVVP